MRLGQVVRWEVSRTEGETPGGEAGTPGAEPAGPAPEIRATEGSCGEVLDLCRQEV
jgi:hypothetical protein